MTTLRKIFFSITSLSALAATNASANVDADLSLCAASALASQQLNAKSIVVETPSDEANNMDHDQSRSIREYRMMLSNNIAGKDLGLVTCRMDRSGKVMSTKFVSAT